MFYDAHAHIDMFEEKELEKALFEARQKNIGKIITCSTSFPSNEKNLELSQIHREILPAIGLYPLDATELTEVELDKAFYFFEAEMEKAIALGEIGLDYKYCTKKEEQEKQAKIFLRFIELSKKYSKPLIVHSRFAQKQALKLLKENKAEKVLLHSFTDSKKLMKQASNLGYFVSAGMNILFNEETQKNIKEFPLENLLLETDSPIRFNGKKTFPENIIQIAKKIAEIKNIPLKELEKQQEKNFEKLFGKE